MTKKKWKKPKLIILTRGTPEENVLEMCKANNETPSIGVNFRHTPLDCLTPQCEQCGTVGTS